MSAPKCIMKWKYKAAAGKNGGGEMAAYKNYIEKQVKDRQAEKGEYALLPDFSGEKDFRKSSESDESYDLRKDAKGDFERYKDYMEYRKGSGGLFSDEGADMRTLKHDMTHRDGIFWIPIISMKEKDAEVSGMDSEQKWIDAARRFVHAAAKEMGVKEENLRWVGAFHLKPESDQNKLADAGCMPHVHLVIWDESGKTPAKVRPKTFEKIRKIQTECFLGDYRRSRYDERNELRKEIKSAFVSESMNQAADKLCDLVYDISVVTGGHGRLTAETFTKTPRMLTGIVGKLGAGETLSEGEKKMMKAMHCTTMRDVQRKAIAYQDIADRLDSTVSEILATPEISKLMESWREVSADIRANAGEAEAEIQTYKDEEEIRKGLKNSILAYAASQYKAAGFHEAPSPAQMAALEQKLAMGKFYDDLPEADFYQTIEVLANAASYCQMPKGSFAVQMMSMIQRSNIPYANLGRIRQAIAQGYDSPNHLLTHTTREVWDAMRDIGYPHDHAVSVIGGYNAAREWDLMNASVGDFCSKTIFDLTYQDLDRTDLVFQQRLREQQQELEERRRELERQSERDAAQQEADRRAEEEAQRKADEEAARADEERHAEENRQVNETPESGPESDPR